MSNLPRASPVRSSSELAATCPWTSSAYLARRPRSWATVSASGRAGRQMTRRTCGVGADFWASVTVSKNRKRKEEKQTAARRSRFILFHSGRYLHEKTAIRVQRLPQETAMGWRGLISRPFEAQGGRKPEPQKSRATCAKNGKGWVDAQPSLFGLMGRNVRT